MIAGQRAIMWMMYRQNANGQPTVSVPAPVDHNTPHAKWWYDTIADMAPELASIGITDVLFPNPVSGEGAPGPGDDGYNPTNDYDIGGLGTPTRFGTKEQFMRAVAVCHANGLNVLLDIVMHQRMGGKAGHYVYRSATGKTNGRFPKTPGCFRVTSFPGGVPEGPVYAPADDFEFGDELETDDSTPNHYVWDGLLAANEWLFKVSGADGGRQDDMKGETLDFMNAFFAADFAKGKTWIGEMDDGNPYNEEDWISKTGRRASVIDFSFQENLAYPMAMSTNTGWRMSQAIGAGLIARDPTRAVPFVSSMDSETDGWATIIYNKLLPLAAMSGSEGMPLYYIKDYLPTPAGYGLGAWMRTMIWAHACMAEGETDYLYADVHTLVFQRTGKPGMIVALSNDIWNPAWTTVTCRCDYPPGWVLKDYSGKNLAHCTVSPTGTIKFGIPPAANGHGYGFWGPIGIDEAIAVTPRHTTQCFIGAAGDGPVNATEGGLDLGPLKAGLNTIGRISCAKGSTISARLTPQMDAGVSFLAPDGSALDLLSDLPDSGYYTAQVTLPATFTGTADYVLALTYLGA